MRKAVTLTIVLALAAVGCGGNPGPTSGGQLTPAQHSARLALVQTNYTLNDVELAHLCPALYPSDVLTAKGLKHYGYDKQTVSIRQFTPAQIKSAAAARCGAPLPLPQPKKPAAKQPAAPKTTSPTTSTTTTSK